MNDMREDTAKQHKPENKPLVSQAVTALKGECTVAGDKSISHRALMIGSQILGTTKIHGLLEGEDVLRTADALNALGVATHRYSQGVWDVTGVGVGGLSESANILDMGNSGTSTRLLMGLVTAYDFTTFFTGDESLRSRPMGRVITPLTQIGASFNAREGGRLPIALKGTKNPLPISYTLPVASAQVKSAILLAGLNTAGITTVIEKNATRDHTENMLQYFGFNVKNKRLDDGSLSISITGQPHQKLGEYEIFVPADPSSAAFLVVAATICPDSELIIRNICVNPLRIGLFITLKEMGAKIEFLNERVVAGEPVADIRVKYSKLKAVSVPAERAPSMIDEYPILAVAAAFADGETVMHGVSELRVKESDRLSAIIAALTACGVSARAKNDSLYVKGLNAPPKGGVTITTNFDHRIAMAFLVMGMASKNPITVDDATAISTSFPNFSELCNSLGAKITPSPSAPSSHSHVPLIIAIDGPAASGKGTLARRLAEHLNLEYLDTGSLYRAVGMKIIYAGKDPSDLSAALEAVQTIDIEDLANPRLRQERIGQAASIVSAFPEIRAALLEFQRDFAKKSVVSGRGVVLDGRDIGTVVCPNADFKFFITATLFARTKRRHKELEGQGIAVVFESVLEDLRERDERDEKRSIAPMRPADDAYIIDSSKSDASEVFKTASNLILKRN
jgi:3-phosphoshikimate 1-carboxyvinyltransferase